MCGCAPRCLRRTLALPANASEKRGESVEEIRRGSVRYSRVRAGAIVGSTAIALATRGSGDCPTIAGRAMVVAGRDSDDLTSRFVASSLSDVLALPRDTAVRALAGRASRLAVDDVHAGPLVDA